MAGDVVICCVLLLSEPFDMLRPVIARCRLGNFVFSDAGGWCIWSGEGDLGNKLEFMLLVGARPLIR